MFDDYDFLNFLVEAKKATYASLGDEATIVPLLQGSKQLEYQKGDYLYRDIYYGMTYFMGQETIYHQDKPIWSMVYSGGTINQCEIEMTKEIYAFLRKALRNVLMEYPYRGPKEFVENEYKYINDYTDDVSSFSGEEFIKYKEEIVYKLNYSGGFIK